MKKSDNFDDGTEFKSSGNKEESNEVDALNYYKNQFVNLEYNREEILTKLLKPPDIRNKIKSENHLRAVIEGEDYHEIIEYLRSTFELGINDAKLLTKAIGIVKPKPQGNSYFISFLCFYKLISYLSFMIYFLHINN